MRDGAYLKRLGADLDGWRTSGAVSAEQATALLDDARTRADVSKSNPAAIAAALGAVLFGLGLITFIAANWGAMPKSMRMLSALLLIWLTFGGVIFTLERRANWIGHAFALAGALAIGAAISLIGQTYNIEGSAAGLLLIWSIGALAVAIAFRSTPVLILYVILAFIWFVMVRVDGFSLNIFGGDRRNWSWGDLALGYIPLWFAGAFLGRRVDSGAAMHLSGLGALVWLFALLCDGIYPSGHREWALSGLGLAALSGAIGAGSEWVRARYSERAAAIALAWSAAAVGLGLIIAEFDIWDRNSKLVEMGFAAAALALATWAITWGEEPGRRAVRGLAVALFAFECFYIYFALFQGLLDTSLFLLGAGALLFGIGFGLRHLTRKKAEPAAP